MPTAALRFGRWWGRVWNRSNRASARSRRTCWSSNIPTRIFRRFAICSRDLRGQREVCPGETQRRLEELASCRVGKVIGRVTLNPIYATLAGGRFLLVEVQDRFSLAGKPRQSTESLVVYDNLGAAEGDLIAFTESREACMPFYPEKRVPLDAYNAAILDAAVVSVQL